MRNWVVLFMVAVCGYLIEGIHGLRFVIDREECFSHRVDFGHTSRFSFVVIKVEGSWNYNDHGVDLVITGPSGEQIEDFRDKTSEKFEFVSHHEGIYHFCFKNKSPYHETIDFDLHAAQISFHAEHAKDEHLKPLYEDIASLEEALYNVQFIQHFLEAQTDRQVIVNEAMSRRAIHKVLCESAALITASLLQVYLLRCLFERKLKMSSAA